MNRMGIYTAVFCVAGSLVATPRFIEHLLAVREDSESGKASHQGAPVSPSPDSQARKLVMQYCQSCHDGGRTSFDFDHASLDEAEIRRNRETWELAVKKLRDKKMPPRKSTQPSDEERETILAWLEEVLRESAPTASTQVIRRLQRAEYLNAVRDLFGVRLGSAEDLPKDDTTWEPRDSHPVLTPADRERYLSAARHILNNAIGADYHGAVPDTDDDDDASAAFGEPVSRFAEVAGRSSMESARVILAAFARRAYRGPVEVAELDRLVDIFERVEADGATCDEGIQVALEEVLISPRFLYRSDLRQAGHSAEDSACGEIELASRLSFFLWSSVPDDELLDHAERGTLRQNLATQVERMLRHPRSKALVRGFANSWLGLDKLDSANLEDKLRRAMKKETRLFVGAVIRENRSVLDLLTADFTFMNEALSTHYGIAGVQGDKFRRVDLQGTGRGGLLTHASILTLTTKTHETSPVIRGKWVLENLLGESVASRPPEVEPNSDRPSQPDTNVFQNPTCAQCHSRMDPIGYALENFGPTGQWRTEHGNKAIIAKGVLPDGEILTGPGDLRSYLVNRNQLFVRVLAEKLLTYARGRRLTDHDRQALAGIPDVVAGQHLRFSRLILEVVQSAPFQMGRQNPGL